MRKLFLSLFTAIAVLSAAGPARACVTDGNNFQAAFRASLILDFNDYGLIFEDAKDPNCSATARQKLITKISTTGYHYDGLGRWVPPFQGWLEGNQVALACAAALMIGGNGDLNSALDAQMNVIRSYYGYNQSAGCGWQISGWTNHGDTCMEEHAAAAAGYAWVAAYVAQRYGYMSAYGIARGAQAQIDQALSTADSICIHDSTQPFDPSGRGPCNVDTGGLSEQDSYNMLSPLLTPDSNGHTVADINAFNRSENIVYGAGQLTVLNGALIGLEEAGWTKTLRSDQQLIAASLIEEAQRKSDPSGSWFKGSEFAPFGTGTCADVAVVNNTVVPQDGNHGCADGRARPKIFNLNSRGYLGSQYSSFAERYLNGQTIRTSVTDHWVVSGQDNYAPQSAYQFNEFDDSLFNMDANENFLGPGRKEVYKNLGWTWSTIDQRRYNDNAPWYPIGDYRPRLKAYLDDNDPKGWLDGITDYGSLGAAVYGWSCDVDRPDFSVKVEIVVDGTVVGEGWAYYNNEQAVTNECGGGTAHRYSIAIPAWTKGHWVQAYGIDATWKGRTLLSAYNCGQLYACTW